jgi:hypothetical protein
MIRFPRPRVRLGFLSGKVKEPKAPGFRVFGKITRKTSRRTKGWDNVGR